MRDGGPGTVSRLGYPVPAIDLREEWRDLMGRRERLSPTLAIYEGLFEAWAHASVEVAAFPWSAAQCRERWARSVPLLTEAFRAVPGPDEVEPLLGLAMELLVSTEAAAPAALQALAEAWDEGRVGPTTLLPAPGRIGTVGVELGLAADAVAFLACASLRPHLEGLLAGCRAHLDAAAWELGACPFCGGPAGFAEIPEDGRRRLACHLCGGSWIFSRLRCPYCGNASTRDLGRLDAEGQEQGYSIAVCKICRAYLKELDRRERWNAGPALVEDWGSPHLDVAATREGYWRPAPPLVSLAGSARS